jgi:voltage-gated potassium channel Kch
VETIVIWLSGILFHTPGGERRLGYFEATYFIRTTISTVGYGDITPVDKKLGSLLLVLNYPLMCICNFIRYGFLLVGMLGD